MAVTNIRLDNVILEVDSEKYATGRVRNVLDYSSKTIEEVLAKNLGNFKGLVNMTIVIEEQVATDLED